MYFIDEFLSVFNTNVLDLLSGFILFMDIFGMFLILDIWEYL